MKKLILRNNSKIQYNFFFYLKLILLIFFKNFNIKSTSLIIWRLNTYMMKYNYAQKNVMCDQLVSFYII